MGRVAHSGEAQNHPSGKALPNVAPADAKSRDEHLTAAVKLGPFAQLLEASSNHRDKLCAIRCVCAPARVIARCSSALTVIRTSDARLEPLRGSWKRFARKERRREGCAPPCFALWFRSFLRRCNSSGWPGAGGASRRGDSLRECPRGQNKPTAIRRR